MDKKILDKDLFKSYSKYCYPVLFLALALIVMLFVSFNSLSMSTINSLSSYDLEKMADIKFEFLGVQLLNFITFILSCAIPIVIALLLGTADKNKKIKENEPTIEKNKVLTAKLVYGSVFIILPFLANIVIYSILICSGFFGTFQGAMILKLVVMTLFGIALSLLTFMLITTIDMALKNAVIDSLLTLAIALFVIHIFYYYPINPAFLIAIIVFVWLALIYLAKTASKKE